MNRFLKGAMILTLAGIIVKVRPIYDGLSDLSNYR